MLRTAEGRVFRRAPAATPLPLSEDIYRQEWSNGCNFRSLRLAMVEAEEETFCRVDDRTSLLEFAVHVYESRSMWTPTRLNL